MECCCHVWAGAPSCHLELLGKLQKLILRTVGPSLAASLEPLAHCRHLVNLSPSELGQLVPLPISRGRSTRHSDKLYNFLSLFLDVTRIYMSTVSFL